MHNSTIKPKAKPCKSTMTKGFGCKKLFLKRTLGLCDQCYPKWLYSTKEGEERVQKHTIPVVKKRESFVAAARDLEERRTLPAQQKLTKDAVHAYIRDRDKGKPCISCGCMWDASHQAGHFYPAGKYSTIEYDENNISGQCQQCNLRKDGNFIGYREGYEKRFGLEALAEIDEKARLDQLKGVHKWEREDLMRIRKFFTAKRAILNVK